MQHACAGSRSLFPAEGLAHRIVGLLRSDLPYLTGFGQGSCISSAIRSIWKHLPTGREHDKPRQPVKCR
ncbi:Uncharacterised protein [Mycobacteroides abscessus subsp. abscessus]|nr:Uncharacterised protein [Mycobacteroides abscessus subsp. abscessus]SIA06497.1 Uncharacterised protein [Mycobacteroides abscessus subsp. abscessus]SIM57687.1 Uncharacterised protein [Mycobacteroides abscessus subsp. abscessus]SKU14631.1 Uncharacterised protein [Mycobacteroides abscessus subsp. abscessus]SKX12717.1 Uncharacterised protein [Mycobacteroides abscessus subsp. abscessus]